MRGSQERTVFTPKSGSVAGPTIGPVLQPVLAPVGRAVRAGVRAVTAVASTVGGSAIAQVEVVGIGRRKGSSRGTRPAAVLPQW